jgi:Abnormal spindle-like microcephaly-assoc'd, ASPM-SPD-2-Hydin/Chitobiase/beta-hexosaminidase C-terminal domain
VHGTRIRMRRRLDAAGRLAGTVLLGLVLESVTACPLLAQCGQPAKEYVRLGGRVIAIENYAPLFAPTFTPPGGTVASSSVLVNATSGAVIYFTTDGSLPNCLSAHTASNTLSLTITNGETVKAFASQPGSLESPVSSATYTIGTSVATLGPSSAIFDDQHLSNTTTLTNTGTAPLTINSISTTDTAAFALNNMCGTLPATLAAGANCTIAVTFVPSTPGVRVATLSVSDSASGSPQKVTLSGGTKLSFGAQNIGASSSQTITVNNSGNTALSISGVSIAPNTTPADFTQTNTCGTVAASGGTCTVTVTFTPHGTGVRSATLNLPDTTTGATYTMPLSGSGTSAGVTLSPSSGLAFGSQTVLTTSAPQSLTLTNSTGATLNFSAIGISPTGEFVVQTNTCGASLPSGLTCSISVTFTPAMGNVRSATLSISDDGPGSPRTAPLSGTGVGGPQVTLSTTTVNFGNLALGQTSPPQTITVTNTGSGNPPLSIWGMAVADTLEFGFLHNCGTLSVGGSCTIQVTYTPNVTGSHSTPLTFFDNTPGSPHTVTLSGVGLNQAQPPTYSIPTFTTVVPGTTVTITAPSGASILFTQDGSNPLTSPTAQLKASPFTYTINNTVTLGAASRLGGMADSTVAWGVYGTNAVTLSPTGAVTLTSGQFITFNMSASENDQWSSTNDYLVMEVSPGLNHFVGACNVQYQPATGTVFLTLDDGASWSSGPMGSPTVLSNSQCTISLAGATTFRSPDGRALTVTMPVSFNASYAGVRALWLDPDEGYRNWYYFGWDTLQANSVTVTPAKVTLYSGQPQQFTANTSANWSMSPLSGTLSGAGAYTSPSTIGSQQVVMVTATSQADATQFAAAAVTLAPGIPADLHLTNLTVFSGSPTYQATHSITADTNVVIGGTANVTFKAGSTITLDPGFKATAVGSGTAFHALIQ